MSYYREVKKNELVAWLLDNGLAEPQPGYGHVDADTLADKLLTKFDILMHSNTQ